MQVEFTGVIFQPVPWSPNTKRGLPRDMEHYLDAPGHVCINIPPNFMFQVRNNPLW